MKPANCLEVLAPSVKSSSCSRFQLGTLSWPARRTSFVTHTQSRRQPPTSGDESYRIVPKSRHSQFGCQCASSRTPSSQSGAQRKASTTASPGSTRPSTKTTPSDACCHSTTKHPKFVSTIGLNSINKDSKISRILHNLPYQPVDLTEAVCR